MFLVLSLHLEKYARSLRAESVFYYPRDMNILILHSAARNDAPWLALEMKSFVYFPRAEFKGKCRYSQLMLIPLFFFTIVLLR